MTSKDFDKARFLAGLPHFTGSETWYRHPLNPSITFTDGAKYVADQCGAYWLLDEIVTNQLRASVRAEEFQHWKLEVKDNKGWLSCDDGNGKIVFTKRIPFTDFPVEDMRFYFSGNVIMMPSEY
jgi:hypothetical protein